MKYKKLAAPKDNDCFFHVVAFGLEGSIDDEKASRAVRRRLAEELAKLLFEGPHDSLEALTKAFSEGQQNAVKVKTDGDAKRLSLAIKDLGRANGGHLDPASFVAWMQCDAREIEELGSKAILKFTFWGDDVLCPELVTRCYKRAALIFTNADIGVEDPVALCGSPEGEGEPIRFLYFEQHYDAFVKDPPLESKEIDLLVEEKKDIKIDSKLDELRVSNAVLLCGSDRLALVHVTPWFAPSAKGEVIDIDYSIRNLEEETVRLKIVDALGETVLDRELTKEEKATTSKGRISWDGQLEKGKYITACQSPFAVYLFDDSHRHGGSKAFRVIVQEIQLIMGRYSHVETWEEMKEPPKSNPMPWVRCRLNQLGYFAGPPDVPLDDYDKKALTRYRANHPTLQKWYYEDYDKLDDMSPVLDALVAGEAARPYFTRPGKLGNRTQLKPEDPLDTGEPLVVHVEAPFFAARRDLPAGTEEMEKQYQDGQDKTSMEAQRMNRPVIPIVAVLLLLGRDDKAKLAPGGVGPVPIRWTIDEPQEDLEKQLPEDPTRCGYAKRYIESCLELEGGRRGPRGNNCLVAFGGARAGRGTDAASVLVPGKHYPPHVAVAVDKAIITKAYSDPRHEPFGPCAGHAGVLFRPSLIAGDTYVVRAEVDASKLLDKLPKVPAKETGPIEVRRFAKIAAVIGWPARGIKRESFEAMRDEYAHAYLDLDISDIAELSIKDVLSQEEYGKWLDTACERVDKSQVEEELSPDVMARCKKGTNAMKEGQITWGMVDEPSLAKLTSILGPNVRKKFPTGAVLLDGLITSVEDKEVERQGLISDLSLGLGNGFVFLNHRTEASLHYLLCHEVGHCFWLMHGRGTARNEEMWADHDLSDRNCMMVYPSDSKEVLKRDPHRATKTQEAHFCGKCNLKLRGWDVRAARKNALPRSEPRLALRWSRERIHPRVLDFPREGSFANLEIEVIGVPPGLRDSTDEKHHATVTLTIIPKNGKEITHALVLGKLLTKPGWGIALQDFIIDETEKGAPWHEGPYFVKAKLDWQTEQKRTVEGTTPAPLSLLPRAVLYGDLADPGLSAMTELGIVEHALGGHAIVEKKTFNADPNIDRWGVDLMPCHIYHQVSHGNLRCAKHERRAFMPASASLSPKPRYPWWCQDDKETIKKLEQEMNDMIFDESGFARVKSSSELEWAGFMTKFLTPHDKAHPMTGVFQWCKDNDSSNDVEFTVEMVQKAFEFGPVAPRWLAFINCCVVGWEETMAKAFLDHGTAYVIAWRCAVSGDGYGREMAAQFYKTWASLGVFVETIEKAFRVVAPSFAGAEPVLFSHKGILHVFEAWNKSKGAAVPEIREIPWSRVQALYELHVPEPKKKGSFFW